MRLTYPSNSDFSNNNVMRLLFIEDEPNSIASVVSTLKETGLFLCKISSFDEADTCILEFLPDIIILDIILGGATGEPTYPGLQNYNYIWEKHFCPIVIYSASPDIFNEKNKPHPFVKAIQKGRNSTEQLVTEINNFTTQVKVLHEVESQVAQAFSLALRDVAPYAYNTFNDPARILDVINRSGRRRLAALMDELTIQGRPLASWEIYISPPICQNLLLGDVIHKKSHSLVDPCAFKIVLSPSCDLVVTGSRESKVDKVLVACCDSFRNVKETTSIKKIGISKLKDRLIGTVLTPGYFERMLPFPTLEDRIPLMAADLKKLELIPIDQVDTEGGAYERIASIDSPFRELISWAYLQIAGRPGVPDRDFKTWCEDIIGDLRKCEEQAK